MHLMANRSGHQANSDSDSSSSSSSSSLSPSPDFAKKVITSSPKPKSIANSPKPKSASKNARSLDSTVPALSPAKPSIGGGFFDFLRAVSSASGVNTPSAKIDNSNEKSASQQQIATKRTSAKSSPSRSPSILSSPSKKPGGQHPCKSPQKKPPILPLSANPKQIADKLVAKVTILAPTTTATPSANLMKLTKPTEPTPVNDPVVEVFLSGQTSVNDVITEKANVSEACCTRVTFSKTQTVYECDAYQQRQLFKNPRSPADEWRTYGAMLKLYEIGGWVIDKKSSRSKKDPHYKYVTKGTAPPKAPVVGPIATQEEFYERRNYAPDPKLPS